MRTTKKKETNGTQTTAKKKSIMTDMLMVMNVAGVFLPVLILVLNCIVFLIASLVSGDSIVVYSSLAFFLVSVLLYAVFIKPSKPSK